MRRGWRSEVAKAIFQYLFFCGNFIRDDRDDPFVKPSKLVD
jgi:hypothetical protein